MREGRAGRDPRRRGISQQEEEGRDRRDRTIERPFPLDCWERCVPGEPKGDFVRMLAQIQIGELGVENDSATESSIGPRSRAMRENETLEPRIAGGMPASTGCDLRLIIAPLIITSPSSSSPSSS